MKKRIISGCLVLGMLLGQMAGLSGCGAGQAGGEEVIELLEPVGNVPGSELASRRTIYNVQVYEVLVEPYKEEYSYSENRNFLSSPVEIGDKVKKGQVLYNTDIVSATEKIEKLRERLDKLREDYEEYCKEAEETLYTGRLELEKLAEDLEDVADAEPEDKTGAEYSAWQKENISYTGSYNRKELEVRMAEEALRQKRELYELDSSYYGSQIKELEQKNAEGVIRAGMDGQIMQLEPNTKGGRVAEGQTVVTVADMSCKLVSCEGMEKSLINMARKIYGFFDGRQYELVYREDYSSYEKNSSSSVFEVLDSENRISVGDSGRVVLYTRLRENVVTVPSDAIHVNGLERYVYVLENGKTVSKTIRLGINDGVYTEILSGIEEGECILLEKSAPEAVDTLLLEKTTVGLSYNAQADLYYPILMEVTCGVENGTVYFDGWPGNFYYDRVEAGTVVAYIWVEGDEQGLLEKEIELKRARERLADIVAGGEEGNEKTIKSRQEEIAALEEELNELKKDYATTEVRTESAGIILGLHEGDYDSALRRNVRIQQGDEMSADFSYAYMYDESVGYLLLPKNDSYGELGYYTMLSFTYENLDNEQVTAEVPVVNVTYDKESRQALLLDREILQSIKLHPDSAWGASRAITKFNVKGTVKTVEDVLILPAEAVYSMSGNFCYVNVLREDGTIQPTGVLTGGKYIDENRKEYYWVIEGLTEGMTICWE